MKSTNNETEFYLKFLNADVPKVADRKGQTEKGKKKQKENHACMPLPPPMQLLLCFPNQKDRQDFSQTIGLGVAKLLNILLANTTADWIIVCSRAMGLEYAR